MVECFSNEARRGCVKAEDVEVGEGRKAYVHDNLCVKVSSPKRAKRKESRVP